MREYPVIRTLFNGVFNKPCWNSASGYGSVLTTEIGLPHLKVYKPLKSDHVDKDPRRPLDRRVIVVRGQWSLWIYHCKWTFSHRGTRIGHSNLSGSSKAPIDRAAARLNGQMLQSVELDPDTGASRFVFDLGGVIATTPYQANTDQWILYDYRPSAKILVYRDDGRYKYGDKWHTLQAGA